MNMSAHASISSEQKIRNLMVSMVELEKFLRKEDRNISREHVVSARRSLATALHFHAYQSPARD